MPKKAMLDITNTGLGLLAATILLFLYLGLRDLLFYARPARATRRAPAGEPANTPLPPVSVVICARDEAANLERNLPLLLSQDYPDYEVVVVDAGSTDRTDELLSQLKARHGNLYYTYIPRDTRYLSQRKLALTIGIKAAKNERLLFTEAYCEPAGPRWIERMMKAGQEVVVGYCRYNHKQGLADRLFAYDNLLGGLRYLSAALANRPYAGDGRNLSYTKRLFFQHKGYSNALYLNRGDDDLFINEVANGQNTRAALDPESQTSMARYGSMTLWLERKASLIATQKHYKGHQVGLYRLDTLLYYLFNIAVAATIVVGILSRQPLPVATAIPLWLARFAIRSAVLSRSARLLGQTFSIGWLPLLEPLLPLFLASARLFQLLNRKKDYTYYAPD